jgi:hypothetical protein
MPDSRANDGGQTGLVCLIGHGFGTAADRRNQIRFIIWTFVWMLGYTLAAQAIKHDWGGLGLQSGAWLWRRTIMALLPNVLAVGAVGAYVRFLRMADELTRLVQLQGMAVGFAASVLLLLNWDLLETAGAPAMDPSDALLVPVFAWVVGQIVSALRYR